MRCVKGRRLYRTAKRTEGMQHVRVHPIIDVRVLQNIRCCFWRISRTDGVGQGGSPMGKFESVRDNLKIVRVTSGAVKELAMILRDLARRALLSIL